MLRTTFRLKPTAIMGSVIRPLTVYLPSAKLSTKSTSFKNLSGQARNVKANNSEKKISIGTKKEIRVETNKGHEDKHESNSNYTSKLKSLLKNRLAIGSASIVAAKFLYDAIQDQDIIPVNVEKLFKKLGKMELSERAEFICSIPSVILRRMFFVNANSEYFLKSGGDNLLLELFSYLPSSSEQVNRLIDKLGVNYFKEILKNPYKRFIFDSDYKITKMLGVLPEDSRFYLLNLLGENFLKDNDFYYRIDSKNIPKKDRYKLLKLLNIKIEDSEIEHFLNSLSEEDKNAFLVEFVTLNQVTKFITEKMQYACPSSKNVILRNILSMLSFLKSDESLEVLKSIPEVTFRRLYQDSFINNLVDTFSKINSTHHELIIDKLGEDFFNKLNLKPNQLIYIIEECVNNIDLNNIFKIISYCGKEHFVDLPNLIKASNKLDSYKISELTRFFSGSYQSVDHLTIFINTLLSSSFDPEWGTSYDNFRQSLFIKDLDYSDLRILVTNPKDLKKICDAIYSSEDINYFLSKFFNESNINNYFKNYEDASPFVYHLPKKIQEIVVNQFCLNMETLLKDTYLIGSMTEQQKEFMVSDVEKLKEVWKKHFQHRQAYSGLSYFIDHYFSEKHLQKLIPDGKTLFDVLDSLEKSNLQYPWAFFKANEKDDDYKKFALSIINKIGISNLAAYQFTSKQMKQLLEILPEEKHAYFIELACNIGYKR